MLRPVLSNNIYRVILSILFRVNIVAVNTVFPFLLGTGSNSVRDGESVGSNNSGSSLYDTKLRNAEAISAPGATAGGRYSNSNQGLEKMADTAKNSSRGSPDAITPVSERSHQRPLLADPVPSAEKNRVTPDTVVSDRNRQTPDTASTCSSDRQFRVSDWAAESWAATEKTSASNKKDLDDEQRGFDHGKQRGDETDYSRQNSNE